jgi:hypothetical protein
MATTLPTFAPEAHEVTTSEDAPAIALDWLHAKDIETEAKKAEKIRKAAGLLLQRLIGHEGTVTVNKGGFRTYVLKVADCQGRVSGERALDALVRDGILDEATAARYLEASRGDSYQTIALKPVKA